MVYIKLISSNKDLYHNVNVAKAKLSILHPGKISTLSPSHVRTFINYFSL